jgi:hypothetical protein
MYTRAFCWELPTLKKPERKKKQDDWTKWMYLYVKWGILVQNTRIITSQCTSRTQLIHRLKMKCTLTLNIYTFFIPYMYMYNHIRLKQKNTSKQTQEIITILSFFIPYITIFVQAEKQIKADTWDNNNTLIFYSIYNHIRSSRKTDRSRHKR